VETKVMAVIYYLIDVYNTMINDTGAEVWPLVMQICGHRR